MVDLFMHLTTHELLREGLHRKRDKNPSFSIRAWAHQMGLSSHGGLQQILSGKRTVPKKYIPRIIQSLGLTSGEAMYFETLVDFEKAKTVEEKDIYYKRLTHLRPGKREIQYLELENFKYFENPLHSIIRVMLDRKDFKNDPKWIKENLRIKTTQREIEEVIERLIVLGLISESGDRLEKSNQSIRNKLDVPSKAVQEYHKKMSMIAAQEVEKQSIDEREYNSFCLNIDKDKIKEAKAKIRDFVDEFIREFEAVDQELKDTYQLNAQLFSLTKDNNNKGVLQ